MPSTKRRKTSFAQIAFEELSALFLNCSLQSDAAESHRVEVDAA